MKLNSKKIGTKLYNYLKKYFVQSEIDLLTEVFENPATDCRNIIEAEYHLVKKILSSIGDKTDADAVSEKTAKELLADAGYILYDDIFRKKDYMRFRQYYANGEVLCKFQDYDATKRGRVFWVVRKDIDNIKRKDFATPKRQDLYGTSCCSILVNGNSIQQICNRYNHRVQGCDNTFGGDLDNIVPGLTAAFNRDYGFKIKVSCHRTELTGFALNDGNKLYYYSHEISGVKIGNNSINGEFYNPDKFLIFDSYVLDLKSKKLQMIPGIKIEDDFVRVFNDEVKKGAKIIVKRESDSDNYDNCEDSSDIIIYKG